MPKFAANLTIPFTELPFLDRFAATTRAGFEAVELLSPYEYETGETKQRLQENQLQLVLFNTPPGDVNAGEWRLAAAPGRNAKARQRIQLALGYTCQLGCPQVHIMAGVVRPGIDRVTCKAVLIDSLRHAAECFTRHDKRILIEAPNPQTKPGYLYHSQYQTLEMMKRADRSNVVVQLDLSHVRKVDSNLSHLTTEYAGQYRHIQITSLPDRHEPDKGEISHPWLYALLDKAGYDGQIDCEYIPRADTLSGLGWFSPYQKK